jgi:sugar-specific transcriptional regulator TrmB
MEAKELLKKAGFSEKEIDVYLALLGQGEAVVSDVAEKANINRSTTYVVLDALAKRGLVTDTERSGVKLFSAGSAEDLVLYLERASDHFDVLAKQARRLLPSFKRIAKTQSEPEIGSAYGAALSSLERLRKEPSPKTVRSSPKPAPRAI